MRTSVLSAIVLAVLVSASCRTSRLTRPALPIAANGNSQFTVIGTMQSRDRIVTVKTGTAGIVYSIATKDGKSLYENVSPEKLKAEAPALHEFIESGVGGWAGLDLPGTRSLLDAGIYAGK
jgi:hypothetical protein